MQELKQFPATKTATQNPYTDKEDNLHERYRSGEQKETHTQLLINCLPENGSWKSMTEIYQEYKQNIEDPVSRQTATKYINDMIHLGDIEAKGQSINRKYSIHDKPIKEVRNNHQSPLSEDLPNWLQTRVKQDIEQKLQHQIEVVVEKRVDQIKKGLERKIREEVSRETKTVAIDLGSSETQVLNQTDETILTIIQENPGIGSSELYETYENQVENPVVRRTVRKYIKQLEGKGLIRIDGRGRWRKFYPVSKGEK